MEARKAHREGQGRRPAGVMEGWRGAAAKIRRWRGESGYGKGRGEEVER